MPIFHLTDLFGRGYSCAPDPLAHPQDTRLFTTQILLVLASSPLPWTGDGAFSLVGYSLGGGIAADFTSYFSHLVDSLILIAPSGIIRPSHISRSSKLLYNGLLPDFFVYQLVRRRLQSGGPAAPGPRHGNPEATTSSLSLTTTAAAADTATQAISGETDEYDTDDSPAAAAPPPPHPALAPDFTTALPAAKPGISIADAVRWQLSHHPAFLPSFISSIQHAPISNQHARWRLTGARLAAQRTSTADDGETSRLGLREGKVLVVLGREDGIVVAREVAEDARGVFGRDGVEVVEMEGAGHDVPISRAGEVVGVVVGFWERGSEGDVDG
ncbi:hypothetical protein LTR28_004147 [Elasticomyces elasticus]|nr:hypothetical protein LTR28_004147 [Elasticomyces elasticus]